MAVLFAGRGDYQEAIRYLKLAADLSPENLMYTYNLAIIHDRLGDHSQARKPYEEVLSAAEIRDVSIPLDAVRERVSYLKKLQTGQRFGMQTMRECIQRLVEEGTVSEAELDRFKVNFGESENPAREGAVPDDAARPQPAAPPAQQNPAAPEDAAYAQRKGILRGRF